MGVKFAELKEAFGVATHFYEEPFADRFDNIPLDENGKPTEEAITALRAELACASRVAQTLTPKVPSLPSPL